MGPSNVRQQEYCHCNEAIMPLKYAFKKRIKLNCSSLRGTEVTKCKRFEHHIVNHYKNILFVSNLQKALVIDHSPNFQIKSPNKTLHPLYCFCELQGSFLKYPGYFWVFNCCQAKTADTKTVIQKMQQFFCSQPIPLNNS